MTLDEAIRHGEAIAIEYEYEIKELLAANDKGNARECIECRDNHVQLLGWLKELRDWRTHQSTNQWINVDDKLPEINEKVLVYIHKPDDDKTHCTVAYLSDKSDDDFPYWVFNEGQFYSTRFKHVTHWQPLPELPKV